MRKGKRKRRTFRKLLGLLLLLVVIVSAAPMLWLRWYDPPTSAFILRNEAATGRDAQHQWVDWDGISPELPLAIIAAEDQKFSSHFGLDLKQIRSAIEANKQRASPRGASTITQQTIKNLFLPSDRSYWRKGLEAWLALWMELILSKQRILEIYMNVAQFGPRAFGAEAGARLHFNIPASELNSRQAALLAASLPTPAVSTPARPSEFLNRRADFLLDQMWRLHQQGYPAKIESSSR